MKSYHMTSGCGIDGIVLREHDEPKPAPREALVRVRAVSLNARELLIARGTYPLPVKPDVIAVSDGAGEVIAVGEDVSRVTVGDRVVASVFPSWTAGPFAWTSSQQLGGSLDGMLTEVATVDENALLPIPGKLSFEEAATLPCAGLTAWNALTGGRGLQAGETVLTLASGGVSIFALQFAKLGGARVIAVASTEARTSRLAALGADRTVAYTDTPAWHHRIREWTDGRGVDHIVEVGGAGDYTNTLKSICPSGEIALVSRRLAATEAALLNVDLFFRSVSTLRVIAVGNRAQFMAMNRAIAANGMHPIIDREFAFNEAVEAFRYYESGKNFGKVVIRGS